MRIHPGVLMSQTAHTALSDEAGQYIHRGIDPDVNRNGLRHVLRHLHRPDYDSRTEAGKVAIRNALLYMINCAGTELLDEIAYADIDSPIPRPADNRELFIVWWHALFDQEDWHASDICDVDVVPTSRSPGGLDEDETPPETEEIYGSVGDYEISPDIVNFPRTDGLPPGHGAPPPDRLFRQPGTRYRPTLLERLVLRFTRDRGGPEGGHLQ